MSEQQKQALNGILRMVYKGKLNPLQAVFEADKAIGGITAVKYGEGLSLSNHRDIISAERVGLGKREYGLLEEFATLAYWKAQQNGNALPGQVHLSRNASTTHHKPGFRTYLNSLLITYKN